jgi:hypothetical protein
VSRKLLGVAAVIAALGWYFFRPERLILDEVVNESLEVAAGDSAPNLLAEGRFHDNAHETSGRADVLAVGGDRRILRLTDFATSNGPDVLVYLVAAADVNDDETVKSAGFVDLGPLKGNRGDQNYEVPATVDLTMYRAVTIWCRRFSVNFGSAPLAPR